MSSDFETWLYPRFRVGFSAICRVESHSLKLDFPSFFFSTYRSLQLFKWLESFFACMEQQRFPTEPKELHQWLVDGML